MECKTSNLDSFLVIGIAIRTTNQNAQSQKDLGDQWTKFNNNNMINKIPDRLTDDIYSVYTEYESDHTGWYTAILGCKVASIAKVPEGFVGIEIPAGLYQVYTPEGRFPENVGNTWEHIWKTATNRKYTADYDVYKAGAKSFEETESEVYLAVE